MSEHSRKRLHGLGAAAAAAAIATVWALSGLDTTPRPHRAVAVAGEPAPATRPALPRQGETHPAGLPARQVASTAEQVVAHGKGHDAEQAAQQRARDAQDAEPIEALEGPRPAAGEALPAIASRAERAMSAADKAAQTDRVLLRLSERSERVRLRLREARARDDREQISRQQLVLARLDQRTSALAQRSRALHEQASLEGGAPADAHDHDAHDHAAYDDRAHEDGVDLHEATEPPTEPSEEP